MDVISDLPIARTIRLDSSLIPLYSLSLKVPVERSLIFPRLPPVGFARVSPPLRPLKARMYNRVRLGVDEDSLTLERSGNCPARSGEAVLRLPKCLNNRLPSH